VTNPWILTGEIGLLPYDARLRLKKAGATKKSRNDPLARIRALNEAEAWVKSTYPQFFKEDSYAADSNYRH
jgi:hypothetical protein